jgi:hypothetical protein
MSRQRVFVIGASMALSACAAVFLAMPLQPRLADTLNRPVWSEAKWPFPIDQWGTGRTFKCNAADCGSEVLLYLRAKIGFCNCATGVADDDELERVGDVELAGSRTLAVGSGHAMTVHSMKGRSRAYAVGGRARSTGTAFSFAFNDRCDVIVAIAMVDGNQPGAQEAIVVEFLKGDVVRRWVETTLGL